MSKPVSKSVHQTVCNLLTLLARQGDADAIEALNKCSEVDVVEDDSPHEVRILVNQVQGDYLVTQHGVSFIPNTERKGDWTGDENPDGNATNWF